MPPLSEDQLLAVPSKVNIEIVILSGGAPLLRAGVEEPAPSAAEGICGLRAVQ